MKQQQMILEELLKMQNPPELVRTGKIEIIDGVAHEWIFTLISYYGATYDYQAKKVPIDLLNKNYRNAVRIELQ